MSGLLQPIAIVVLGVFTVITIIIGIISTRKANSIENFLLAGRNLGPLLSAFSYGTTYFSAVIFIGYAGMFGWMIGLGSIWIGVGNAIIGCLIAWLILAKPTRRMTHTLKSRTVPEFFAARYLSRTMKIYAALIIFIFLVPYAASVYKGLGSLFSAIFVGVSPLVCMAIVAILTAIYLVLGGYIATALNDLIQGCIMIFGLICMILVIVNQPEVGGFSQIADRLRDIDPGLVDMTGGGAWKVLATNILLTSFGVWGMPQMVHKYYAVREGKSIRYATIISTLFAVFIGVGAYLTGSLSHLFFQPDAATGLPGVEGGYDFVVPAMLIHAMTNSIFGIIILCVIMLLLLSASMSTLSGLVLSSSSAVTIDLIEDARPDIKKSTHMLIMRGLCLLFVILSFIFASLNISFIVNLMSFSWGVVAGSFIGPFIWGLYARFISKAGAWCGLLSGPVVVGVLLIVNTIMADFDTAKGMAPTFGITAMGVSIVITPLVSAITRKYEQGHLDNVFKRVETAKAETN